MATTEEILFKGVDAVSNVASGIGDKLGSLASIAGGALAAGVGAATAAVVGSVNAFSDWAGKLDSLGDVLGTTADESAAIDVAIEGVGGNVEAVTGQMAKLTTGLTDSAGGLGKTGELLKQLGVSAFESNGKVIDLNNVISPKTYSDMASDVDKANVELKKMEDAMAKAKNPTDAMRQSVELQQEKVKSMEIALGKAYDKVVDLSEQGMRPASQIMQEVATKISAMPDGLEKSKLMMELFGKSGKDMTDTLSALSKDGLEKAAQKAKDYGLAVGDDGVNSAVEMGKAQKDLELMLRGMAVTVGAQVLPALVPLAQQLLAFAREHLPPIIEGLKGFGQWIGSLAASVTAFVASSGFVDFMHDAGEALRAAFKGGQEIAETVWPVIQRIVGLIGDIFTTIFGDTKDGATDMGDTVKQVFDVMGDVIKTALDIIEGVLTVALALFKGLFRGNWDDINRIVNTAVTSLTNIVRAEMVNVTGAIKIAFNQAVDFVKTLPTQFEAFGKSIIDGIAQGIQNGADAVHQALIQFLKNTLPAWAIELLGIHSPSAVFVPMGEQISAGLAAGILSGAGSVYDALRRVTDGSLSMDMRTNGEGLGDNFNMSDQFNIYGNQNVAAEIARARREATRQAILRAQVIG